MYKYTHATVKGQIQYRANATPATVSSMETAHDENGIILDYLTSEVVLEECKVGSIHPNILRDNNCTDDELHFGMPGHSGDYENSGDENNMCVANPTPSWQRWAMTEPERTDLGTSTVDRYEGDNGDTVDADEEEEALQGDDGSIQNLEDWGHCIGKCEDWTAYFWPVKYGNGDVNETASDVSEAKTVL